MTAALLVSAAGCSGSSSSGESGQSGGQEVTTSGGSTAAGTSAGKAESGAPSLTYWVKMDSSKIAPTTSNYGTIMCYQAMMKNTGINVEFIHPPVGQEADSFSLMTVSYTHLDVYKRQAMNTEFFTVKGKRGLKAIRRCSVKSPTWKEKGEVWQMR